MALAGVASHAVGADAVGCDQPGIQPRRTQPPRPRLRTVACCHRHQASGRQLRSPTAPNRSPASHHRRWPGRHTGSTEDQKTPPRSLNCPCCSDALQGRQKANQRLSAIDVEARHTTPRCGGRIVDSRRKNACLPLHRTPPLPIPRFTGSPDLHLRVRPGDRT